MPQSGRKTSRSCCVKDEQKKVQNGYIFNWHNSRVTRLSPFFDFPSCPRWFVIAPVTTTPFSKHQNDCAYISFESGSHVAIVNNKWSAAVFVVFSFVTAEEFFAPPLYYSRFSTYFKLEQETLRIYYLSFFSHCIWSREKVANLVLNKTDNPIRQRKRHALKLYVN